MCSKISCLFGLVEQEQELIGGEGRLLANELEALAEIRRGHVQQVD